MLDLYDELRAITRTLESEEIAYALIGGLAVSIYAAPRATEDVDLLVAAADLGRIRAALAPLGYEPLAQPMTFAGGRVEIHRFTKLVANDHLVLDLMLAHDAREVATLAGRIAAGAEDERVWVAPLEGLRELKRLRNSPQDIADLEALGDAGP